MTANTGCLTSLSSSAASGQIHGARRLAQAVGNDFVLRREAGARVHQENHGIGFIHGLQGLLGHFVQDAAVHHGLEAAGVHHEIGLAAHFAVAVMAVAREAGQVVHQCVFGAREAVEQGGFAHIGAAD